MSVASAVPVPTLSADRRAPAAAWAVFLATSWTWCIGMFLPTLLIRDHGLASWFVFAVPNVFGAAAMGFVLSRRESSQRFVARHRLAALAFSLVTVAFHGWFIGFIFAIRGQSPWAVLVVFAALVGIAWLACLRFRRGDLWTAAIVWVASLAAMLFFGHYRGVNHIHLPEWFNGGSFALAWLAPVCLFGFALCPYLDLTFHRARQQTSDTGAKLAFGLGFGVLFLLMIVFTVVYADLYDRPFLGAMAVSVLMWHVLSQAAATCGFHLRELTQASPRWAVVAAVLAAGLLIAGGSVSFDYAGLSAGEIGYRSFLAFYGLAFPAYVWIVAIAKRPWWVALVAVALATPFYWVGFIERQMIWLMPGLLIALAGAVVPLPRRAPAADAVAAG